ncbi:MAG: L-histidine N-alpha-methyltransferase [Bacteroidia bacterium]|jgi:L-histidine N-alpha-methyltransferase
MDIAEVPTVISSTHIFSGSSAEYGWHDKNCTGVPRKAPTIIRMEKTFAEEVAEGLSAEPKYLSSKYHYDDEGSRIFQEIMAMPEYYLTGCEMDIMQNRAVEILEATGFTGHFNIIELGAGDGLKTKELLRNLLTSGADFTYVPIDISEEAINLLVEGMQTSLPDLKMNPQVGDYFEMMDKIEAEQNCPSIILFLGSNIGNFKPEWALDLLKHINQHMRINDLLMVGFDLMKDPNLIRNAYQDPAGITKRFNMNLLSRINRELGGNFNLDQFDYYSFYNPDTGDVRSYLVSLEDQEVKIDATGKSFHFNAHELIWAELSKKYSLSGIEQIGEQAGFKFEQHFLDSKKYFSDSLFVKA